MPVKKRRYDLDWLRVIAIIAVYLHHIGMPFNGDQFHIMNTQSSKLLDDVMVFFEQFRLPLLFLISGTGTMYAFSKRTWFQFVKERSRRLLIPLCFGVIFIVPPQTFFEHFGRYPSYLDIYKDFSFEVNHLWFIENLFIMSMFVIPIILFLKSKKSVGLKKVIEAIASRTYGVLLGVIPLVIITILFKKIDPSDSKDITNLSSTFYYGYFFIGGMLFASSKHLWNHLKQHRRFNFVCCSISVILFYGYYFIPNNLVTPYLSINAQWSIWHAVCALLSWTLITSILGYAQIWLNKESVILKRSNEAIYPFYILHQTIIIILGFYIIQYNWSIQLKMTLLIFTSFPITILLYRYLIYPFRITRILFGMKKKEA